MSKHRQGKKRSKRRKIAIASAVVVTVGAIGIPVAAQASGVGLGGLRSVAFSWWGGDTSDTASPTPSRKPSVSATPSAADTSASPSGTPSPSRSRTSPSASPSKSGSPTARPTADTPDTPDKTTSPPSTPKATRAPTTPRAAASSVASGPTDRVLALVNSERQKAGCAPVTENSKLTKAAQNHSQDMADHQNMSHTGSDGSSMTDRLARVGYAYRSAGENVAAGYGTPESVMDGWMNSPGHKANILNCGFKEIGIGLAQPGNYWTQNFGSSA
ncbi:CAP domain-containing protein [Streptomyces sp. DSM 40750]|uniref:CAP domain-containing protein n=1 Tax=Streptomyces sp. DSM 40750 TaxID=2801030 RepID=UPI00214AA003|nr:CAP domain-containing protein [Streptomyces sp. DSM 40750]UUU23544.1 CAP domain-containing protein [Streptomyces sp. DSM 40750]